jgi:hypothetical protein
MSATQRPFAVLLLAALVPGVVLADPYVYPAKGQSKQQQEKDQYECYDWAKGKTGFDPMKQPQATTPPPPQQAPEGGLLRGGARGAALGAVGGAIGGDAGKGAAIGALAGGMIGGMRRRHQVQDEAYQQQQWANNQAANYENNRSNYNRAYAACLGGRGYTVN